MQALSTALRAAQPHAASALEWAIALGMLVAAIAVLVAAMRAEYRRSREMAAQETREALGPKGAEQTIDALADPRAPETARQGACPAEPARLRRGLDARSQASMAGSAQGATAEYACPVCGVLDPYAFLRCYHPGCPDGRDPRDRS